MRSCGHFVGKLPVHAALVDLRTECIQLPAAKKFVELAVTAFPEINPYVANMLYEEALRRPSDSLSIMLMYVAETLYKDKDILRSKPGLRAQLLYHLNSGPQQDTIRMRNKTLYVVGGGSS